MSIFIDCLWPCYYDLPWDIWCWKKALPNNKYNDNNWNHEFCASASPYFYFQFFLCTMYVQTERSLMFEWNWFLCGLHKSLTVNIMFFVAAMSAKVEIISKFKSTFHCGGARDCDGAGASFPRSVSGSVLFLVWENGITFETRLSQLSRG